MRVAEPLLVPDLVSAVVLRGAGLQQPIRPVPWSAAAVTCLCLAVFLATSEPHGGHAFPSSHAWVTAGGATVGAAAVLTLLGMKGSPARRAALLASATAAMWALVATLIKTTTETLSQFGVAGMFTHWPGYALAAPGLGTEILRQANR